MTDTQQLLAAVSHDLRAPMSTILLWERVLRDRFGEPDVRERALDAIRESATAQSDLIAGLADVASLLDGTRTLHVERITLDELLAAKTDSEGGVAGEGGKATRKGVAIVRDYDVALGDIAVDRTRMRRVLETLVARAVKLTAPGRTVSITAERKQRSVLIAIGDLERNHEHDIELRTPDLHLVLAREVLRLHGGALQVTRPKRGGTPTYWLRLPLARRRTTRR